MGNERTIKTIPEILDFFNVSGQLLDRYYTELSPQGVINAKTPYVTIQKHLSTFIEKLENFSNLPEEDQVKRWGVFAFYNPKAVTQVGACLYYFFRSTPELEPDILEEAKNSPSAAVGKTLFSEENLHVLAQKTLDVCYSTGRAWGLHKPQFAPKPNFSSQGSNDELLFANFTNGLRAKLMLNCMPEELRSECRSDIMSAFTSGFWQGKKLAQPTSRTDIPPKYDGALGLG